MDAFHVARRHGFNRRGECLGCPAGSLQFLETDWERPDEGIWEVCGPKRQFTHSKVMAWVAADRAVRAVEKFGLAGDSNRWRKLRQKIHDQVCTDGFNADVNSFVQYYGSREPDASLLMLPLVGFLPATDPRIIGTVNYIRKRLVRDGLVDRYLTHSEVNKLPENEGSFLLCTFWLADNLALQGRQAEAREIFERLLSLRNDLGLLSEQYDPQSRRLVGNFPQAFSHVGLINTARNLTSAAGPAQDRRRAAQELGES